MHNEETNFRLWESKDFSLIHISPGCWSDFHSSVEKNSRWLWFSKNSRHFLDQSEVKPIMIRLHTFSRAGRRLHITINLVPRAFSAFQNGGGRNGRVFSRRAAIMKIVEERALGRRLLQDELASSFD